MVNNKMEKEEIKESCRENCIICEKEIFRADNGRMLKERRSKNSITCSKECSRIYIRVRQYINQLWRQKLK